MRQVGDACEESRWSHWASFQELGGEKEIHRTVAGEGEGTEDELLKNQKDLNSTAGDYS